MLCAPGAFTGTSILLAVSVAVVAPGTDDSRIGDERIAAPLPREGGLPRSGDSAGNDASCESSVIPTAPAHLQ